MKVFDLFSKRSKRTRGENPDVFQYEEFDQKIRIQIIHIWQDALGGPEDFRHHYSHLETRDSYKDIVGILRREYGVFTLHQQSRTEIEELFNFLLSENDFEKVLDAIEVSFKYISLRANSSAYNFDEIGRSAIDELNTRFKESGIGYQFQNDQIMRVDSLQLHKENILPALKVLSERRFSNANEEFRSAFEHQKKRNNQEAISDCLKCFESVMKIILVENGQHDVENLTSSKLLNKIFERELVPKYLSCHVP